MWLRPYLHGPADLLEFLQKTFNAVEPERNEFTSLWKTVNMPLRSTP